MIEKLAQQINKSTNKQLQFDRWTSLRLFDKSGNLKLLTQISKIEYVSTDKQLQDYSVNEDFYNRFRNNV